MAVGCISKHSVFIHDRGGIQRLDELVDIQSLTYSRVRDATSTASVTIAPKYCAAQRSVLDRVVDGCGRYELAIYRGDDRVWEGPTQIVTDSAGGFTVEANDITQYWKDTVVHAAYSNAYPNIGYTTDRAKLIMQTELARKEALGYNLLDYCTFIHTPSDAKTSRVTLAMSEYLFNEIDDLAEKSGMDYTVVGRQAILWDTDQNIGQTPTLTNADFLGDGIIVSSYGGQAVTRSIASDGQGNFGQAGGVDPFYGEIEVLWTPTEDAQNAGTPPDTATLNSQAAANLTGKLPAPLIIRTPDTATINPSGVLKMGDFVPGVYVPIQASINGRVISQWQKFDSITFKETSTGETIQATFSPAPIGAVIV